MDLARSSQSNRKRRSITLLSCRLPLAAALGQHAAELTTSFAEGIQQRPFDLVQMGGFGHFLASRIDHVERVDNVVTECLHTS